MNRVPVAGPWVTDREVDLVTEAARYGWYEDAGLYTGRFETAFAAHVGVEHAFAVPSCTSALHLALAALGIGPGDEVIVPDATWIATAAPIMYLGATPVFADVDPITWCIDPRSVAACLTDRTKAIIGVDLYGSMCNWPALRGLAKTRGIALIEDAAEAIGSTLYGRSAGSWADFGCFSFHGSKTLTTGEGGMLVTGREELRDRVARLRDHGRAPGDTRFFNEEIGFKYRMSGLCAAFGLGQLERINELVEKKREIFARYQDKLRRLPGVFLNAEPTGVKNSYWMTTAVWDHSFAIDKHSVIDALRTKGIDSRPFFHPLSSLPAFANQLEARRAQERNGVAYQLSQRGINLPSALLLTDADVDRTAAAFERIMVRKQQVAVGASL